MANLINSFFGSPLFTWWNSATVGTRLFTAFKGQQVGTDADGNLYYKEKNGKKRWVIYKNGPVEASRVPAEWHGWLHYTTDKTPVEAPFVVKSWEKDHEANHTGSAEAYVSQVHSKDADYEAWKP